MNPIPCVWNPEFATRRDLDYSTKNKPYIKARAELGVEYENVVRAFMRGPNESNVCVPQADKAEEFCFGANLESLRAEKGKVSESFVAWLEERSSAGGDLKAHRISCNFSLALLVWWIRLVLSGQTTAAHRSHSLHDRLRSIQALVPTLQHSDKRRRLTHSNHACHSSIVPEGWPCTGWTAFLSSGLLHIIYYESRNGDRPYSSYLLLSEVVYKLPSQDAVDLTKSSP
jgi:hypothetical protein